jgi:hypothetical protein
MIVSIENTVKALCEALGEVKAATALQGLKPSNIMGINVYDSDEIQAAIKNHQTPEQLAALAKSETEQKDFLQEIINEHKNK